MSDTAKRWITWTAASFALALTPIAITLAQKPTGLPELTFPKDGAPVVQPIATTDPASHLTPGSEHVEKAIRRVLHEGGGGLSGDPMLNDVLQVLKDRGSVLNGSSLDIENPTPPGSTTASRPQTKLSREARAAEMLLKAARILEQLSDQDITRRNADGHTKDTPNAATEIAAAQRDLIRRMRSESVRLLAPITSAQAPAPSVLSPR